MAAEVLPINQLQEGDMVYTDTQGYPFIDMAPTELDYPSDRVETITVRLEASNGAVAFATESMADRSELFSTKPDGETAHTVLIVNTDPNPPDADTECFNCGGAYADHSYRDEAGCQADMYGVESLTERQQAAYHGMDDPARTVYTKGRYQAMTFGMV